MSAPSIGRAQLCYDIAYRILPAYLGDARPRLEQLLNGPPRISQAFFYVMACTARKVEPIPADTESFAWHRGELRPDARYDILEYPAPYPVDLSGAALEDITAGRTGVVLAPHFSCFVVDGRAGPVRYFVLGQAPMGGGTTLRELRDGANLNLGAGPVPRLDAFLSAVRDRVS